jgi:5-methylcytosine-specific restriction protein A
MISSTQFLRDASLKYSRNFVFLQEENFIEIRFDSLPAPRGFSLRVERNWRSTTLTLFADAFAADIIHFLAKEVFLRKAEVSSIVDHFSIHSRRMTIEIDSLNMFDPQLGSPIDFRKLKFEVEVLSAESSIQHGLLTEPESELIEFSLAVFSALLPRESDEFHSPEETLGFPEGAVTKVEVNKYERDPRNRRAAIALHGISCQVCGFNFEEKYGRVGSDYVVVHHLVPVSELGENYILDPASDLATLCANCHAMAHRRTPPYGLDELKALLLM